MLSVPRAQIAYYPETDSMYIDLSANGSIGSIGLIGLIGLIGSDGFFDEIVKCRLFRSGLRH